MLYLSNLQGEGQKFEQAEQRHERSESATCVRQNHTFACKREWCRLTRGVVLK